MPDTNVAIAVLRGHPAVVRDRLRDALERSEVVALPTVAVFELWYGVARSARPRENAERVRVLLAGDVITLPFEDDDAAITGELRGALEGAGTPIGAYDLLIAAQALRTGATLVTANGAEFARIRDLRLENLAAGEPGSP